MGESARSAFVPTEGLKDRSQAIYCLEQVQSRIRPVGHGLILTPSSLIVLIVACRSDPIIPCPTDPKFTDLLAVLKAGNRAVAHISPCDIVHPFLTPDDERRILQC